MRICYECGKEISDQKEMVLKEFKVADCGVRWIKPFHTQCWQRRQKTQQRNYSRICFAVLSILTCIVVAYLVLTLL